MEFTGERYIPGIVDNTQLAYEHWQRYFAASKLIKDKIVLDIACGEGYGAYLLAQSALQVYGVDISCEAINHASRKYERDNLSFHCGSVNKLDFNDESIDVIVSLETIEHVDVEMQKDFLKEASRILKKDGFLFVSCPNKKVATEFAWDTWQFRNEFHIKEYYIDEFNVFLKDYFKHVQLYFQRYEIALILSSTKAANLEIIMNNGKVLNHTQNIIAICSKSQIKLRDFDSIVLESEGDYLNNLATIADLKKHSSALQDCNIELQKHVDELHNLNTSILNQYNALQVENVFHQNKIKDSNAQIADLQSLNNYLHNQIGLLQDLADELHRIYNTRSWKLLNKAYNIKKIFIHINKTSK